MPKLLHRTVSELQTLEAKIWLHLHGEKKLVGVPKRWATKQEA
jgi:hypothetical protein